jgi:hypothetical protein
MSSHPTRWRNPAGKVFTRRIVQHTTHKVRKKKMNTALQIISALAVMLIIVYISSRSENLPSDLVRLGYKKESKK